jgi:hypothetical protein
MVILSLKHFSLLLLTYTPLLSSFAAPHVAFPLLFACKAVISPNPDPEDAAGVRTGAFTGSACLTCSTRLRKENSKRGGAGAGAGEIEVDRESAPSRGGGFMLNQPRRPLTEHRGRGGAGGGGGPSIGSAQGVGFRNPPSSARPATVPTGIGGMGGMGATSGEHLPPHTSRGASPDQPKDAALPIRTAGTGAPPPAGTLLSGFGFHGSSAEGGSKQAPSRAEVGSDGKLYTAPGSRTHRMLVNPQPPRPRRGKFGDLSS